MKGRINTTVFFHYKKSGGEAMDFDTLIQELQKIAIAKGVCKEYCELEEEPKVKPKRKYTKRKGKKDEEKYVVHDIDAFYAGEFCVCSGS